MYQLPIVLVGDLERLRFEDGTKNRFALHTPGSEAVLCHGHCNPEGLGDPLMRQVGFPASACNKVG